MSIEGIPASLAAANINSVGSPPPAAAAAATAAADSVRVQCVRVV